jgi:hypothetical protein
MTPTNGPASRSIATDPRIIAAPRASDALAGVFRTAFGPTDETPDDFRAILARLDRCEPGKH